MVGARGLQSDDKRFKEERPVLVAGCVPVNTPKPMPSYTLSCVNCVVCGLHLKKKKEGRREEEAIAGYVSYRSSCARNSLRTELLFSTIRRVHPTGMTAQL